MSSPEPAPVLPLSAVLSAALVAFTIEADNEAEHRLPHRTTVGGPSAGATATAPWLTSPGGVRSRDIPATPTAPSHGADAADGVG